MSDPDLFGAAPPRKPTKREGDLLEANRRTMHVPCSRCGAEPGQPCVSCNDNITLPHTARVMLAAGALAGESEEPAHG